MSSKKEHKRLTIAELKNFKGFEGYSNEQAEEAIKTLEKLSLLFYHLHLKQKSIGKTYKISRDEELKIKHSKKTKNE